MIITVLAGYEDQPGQFDLCLNTEDQVCMMLHDCKKMVTKKSMNLFMTALLGAVIFVIAGCETHAEKKQAMYDKWGKTSAAAKVPLAREFYDVGQTEDARKILIECLEADPEMPAANLLMGKLNFTQGHMDDAHQCFATVARVDEKSDEAMYWLGLISGKDGKLNEALKHHTKALSLEPVNVKYVLAVSDAYVALNDLTGALEVLEQKDKLIVGSIEIKVAAADILQQMGDISKAILTYQRALLLDEHDADVIAALGYCYIGQQQWGQAAEMFEMLLADSNDTQRVTQMELLAKCSMNSGEYGRAMSYYDQLSIDQRDNAEIWLRMGQAALGGNASKRAIACANKALSLNPGSTDAILLKGCAQYLSDDYKGAVHSFSRVIGDKKMGAFAWTMTGRCYQQMDLNDNAQKAYDNARRLDPGSKLVSVLTSGGGDLAAWTK